MVFCQMPSPEPGSAGEFEHIPSPHRRSERPFNRRDFAKPLVAVLGSAIVPSFPQEPLVVLRRPCPVVRNLLTQKLFRFHAHQNIAIGSDGGPDQARPTFPVPVVSRAPRGAHTT